MPVKGFVKGTRPDGLLFDEIDRALVESRTWHIGARGYARSTVRDGKRCYGILLAREIMQAPKGMDVDHINGNTLDNRRENLRVVPHKHNQQNQRPRGLSGVRGVTWNRRQRCWRAQSGVNGKTVNLGNFKSLEAAAAASEAYLIANAPGYVPGRLTNKNPLNLATA